MTGRAAISGPFAGSASTVWDDYEAALEAYAANPTPETAFRLEGLAQIYRRRLAVEAWRAPGRLGYPWTGGGALGC